MPEYVDFIILHCTATPWGTVESTRVFHTAPAPYGRGWSDIGYNALITGPYPTAEDMRLGRPRAEYDGKLWPGRDLDKDGDYEEEIGAHVHGWNRRSFGLALVGQAIRAKDGILSPVAGKVIASTFTAAQIQTALGLTRELCHRHEISFSHVIGHCEVPGVTKSCPDIDMVWFRDQLRAA